MVDPTRARHLVARFRRYRRYLEELAERPESEVLDDFAVLGGVKHYLQVAIETALDLGSHVISSEGYEPPSSYADIFRVLGDEGVVSEDLALRLMAMAKFRNVLVHQYAEVDDERVLRILKERTGDLDEFVDALRDRFAEELGA